MNFGPAFRLGINYGSFFLYSGILMPFIGLWLKSKGLTAGEIGVIIALPHIMKIVTAPFISQVADKREEYWRPLILCTAISLFFFAFYFLANDFLSIFLVSLAVNLFMPAMMPLFETITISQVKKHNLNYGRLRAVGSFTFIVANILFGFYLKNNSVDTVLWASFICLGMFFITAFWIPRGNSSGQNEVDYEESPLKKIILNGEFVTFLMIVGLIQMSHGVYYAMGSIHWQSNGLTEDMIGILWATGIVAEIIIFVFCQKIIVNLNIHKLLIFIAFAGILRWLFIANSFSVLLLFIVQLTHGLTYGAAHFAAIHYIGHKVPEKYAATAQSLYTSLPMGVAMALSTYLGSVYYGYKGYMAFYAMCGLCILSIFLSLYALSRKK